MKRFILSAFSVMLAVSAVSTRASAFPQVDSAFNIQTLRLSELDTRNKSEDDKAPYYPYGQTSTQTPEWTTPQTVGADEESTIEAEASDEQATPSAASVADDASTDTLSVIERRQQVLDRS